ncbi:uncharacterized protein LOC144676855, partial [Cetorhinus maximus]
ISLEDLEDDDLETMQAMGLTTQHGRDTRRMPIYSSAGELELLLSLAEEESEEEDLHGVSGSGIRVGRNKAGSMSRIDEMVDDYAPIDLQPQDVATTLSHQPTGTTKGDKTKNSALDAKGSTKKHRTVSFLKKMAGLTKVSISFVI